MKKKLFICAVAALAVLAGCEKQESKDPNAKIDLKMITIDADITFEKYTEYHDSKKDVVFYNLIFKNNRQYAELSLECNRDWEIIYDEDSYTDLIDKKSGSQNSVLRVTLPTSKVKERMAHCTINIKNANSPQVVLNIKDKR